MRYDLHQCLKQENDGCDKQIKKGSIKLCTEENPDCPFFAEHPLGKMDPEDFLFP